MDSKILTNENIQFKANQGIYSEGSLKFYVITKKAAIDQSHSARCCDYWGTCSHSNTVSVDLNDYAGDYYESSTEIHSGSSQILYVSALSSNDEDYYYFSDLSTGTYKITAIIIYNNNNYTNNLTDLDCEVFTANGTKIYEDTDSGNVNLNSSFNGGSQYYIKIFNKYDNLYSTNSQMYKYAIKIEGVST